MLKDDEVQGDIQDQGANHEVAHLSGVDRGVVESLEVLFEGFLLVEGESDPLMMKNISLVPNYILHIFIFHKKIQFLDVSDVFCSLNIYLHHMQNPQAYSTLSSHLQNLTTIRLYLLSPQ